MQVDSEGHSGERVVSGLWVGIRDRLDFILSQVEVLEVEAMAARSRSDTIGGDPAPASASSPYHLPPSLSRYDWVVILGGINDIGSGTTAETAFNGLVVSELDRQQQQGLERER